MIYLKWHCRISISGTIEAVRKEEAQMKFLDRIREAGIDWFVNPIDVDCQQKEDTEGNQDNKKSFQKRRTKE